MSRLLDKLIILALCMAVYFQNVNNSYAVVPVIIAITLSALCSYFEENIIHIVIFVVFAGAAIFYPPLIFFLPLVCYDIIFKKWFWPIIFAALPIVINFSLFSVFANIVVVILIALTYFIKLRTISIDQIRGEYLALRDNAMEHSLNAERKNKELMEKQDYEINLATLNERNRIARDIHDSVGHTLSSSILQIGALIATCKDESLKESLHTLKITLSQGMDSIRNSIHNLHDESVDLYTETLTLVKGFSFCEIELEYDIDANPNQKIKYAFLSVVKEALANIIKHSNATYVKVTLREHPALYQLIIKDNGTKRSMNSSGGIGIKSINDRINSINGITNINDSDGFVIFISVPKGTT